MKNYVKGYVHIPTGSNVSFRTTWLERRVTGYRVIG